MGRGDCFVTQLDPACDWYQRKGLPVLQSVLQPTERDGNVDLKQTG